ncbi:ABC transporter ATP-binding protein [Sphingobacterium paludis]|uniref:ABC-2 type transport system ATP-binding protein n=1 Tax=Sphingobacterium paludis TaxID=1476465 RepID=A0A4V3E0W8_9SPHI|nr:ABC transporter ATP-binding protein [Sphingobacterium paludis]TDS08943.1 ABC-2 type transport system ATP-binding protein [Sphingobacterium paludis]
MMLEAVELTKLYGSHIVLDHLNLQVKSGEVFCLMGQNGAGKTTTLNLFLGFIAASSGQAWVDGKLVSPGQQSSNIAYIPEVVMLYPYLSSLENLDFFSRLAGYRYPKDKLCDYLSQVGLQPEAFEKRVGQQSKGMRQKIGIAIAMAKNAKVILMDEPTSGLDPQAMYEFNENVRAMREAGKAILMATHDIYSAIHCGTRIGIMKQGSLVKTLRAEGMPAAQLENIYLTVMSSK